MAVCCIGVSANAGSNVLGSGCPTNSAAVMRLSWMIAGFDMPCAGAPTALPGPLTTTG